MWPSGLAKTTVGYFCRPSFSARLGPFWMSMRSGMKLPLSRLMTSASRKVVMSSLRQYWQPSKPKSRMMGRPFSAASLRAAL